MNALIKNEKKAEVVELPLKLNLQFFSDEVEDTDTPDDTETEESIDETVTDEQDTGGNDSDLANQKPVQDAETNARFAEMRRQAEQAEARARHADELIAQQYGESHGIYTVEQYEEALKAEQQELERQQYLEMGIDPDEIEKIVDKKLENHPAVIEAKKQAADHKLLTNFNQLQSEYSDLVKSPEDVPVEVWQRWNDGNSGLSLTEAYELVNKQTIREHLTASTKQSTLNKINSKEHVRGNGGEGADDMDLTSVPADVMATYRQMFSKELRTGKMKESDFVKHYKNSNK